jgi:hypothetical protein
MRRSIFENGLKNLKTKILAQKKNENGTCA